MKETELSRREFMKGVAVAGSLAFWNPWETVTEAAGWIWDGTTAAACWVWDGSQWIWDGTTAVAGWVWDGSQWIWRGTTAVAGWVWDGSQWIWRGTTAGTGWVWDGVQWIWKGTTADAGWVWDGVQWIWKGTTAGAGWVWDGVQWVANGLIFVPAEVWDRFVPKGWIVYIHEKITPYVASGTGSAAVTGIMLNTFRQNLSWEELPRELQTKYHLAGGEWKNVAEAQQLYRQVPFAVRTGGPSAVWEFHAGRDWSHIVPKDMGGDVTQGIWWDSGKNRALGARPMSWAQIWDARRLLFHEQVKATIRQALKVSVKGAPVGTAISVLFSVLEHGLDYAQEKITLKELRTRVGMEALQAGSAAFVLSSMITAIALLFPSLFLIMAPLAWILFVVGLGTLGFEMTGLAQSWWRFLADKAGIDPRPQLC